MKTILSTVLIALGVVFFTNAQHKQSRKPNIIFILIDDMGWSDLACYGSSFYESPNIDALAKTGIRFTNAYATPVCAPTRASIMTGKNPARRELTNWRNQNGSYTDPGALYKFEQPSIEYYLDAGEDNLAKSMKAGGYPTFFAGKWHLAEADSLWPEHQGFDVNKGGYSGGAPYYRKYTNETDTWTGESGYYSPYKNPRLEDGPWGEHLTDRLTQETISFIKESKDKPFFVYLSYYDVHNPMHGKEHLVERFKKKANQIGLDSINPFVRNKPWMQYNPKNANWKERLVQSNTDYAAMIYGMDENIGKLLSTLKQLDIDDNTIIVLMSDNGGLSTQEGSVTSNLPLRGGKGWLYEGGIRVPMIIRWPGHHQEGIVSETPVVTMDVFPTLLDFAGLPLKPLQHIDGTSLKPILEGKELQRKALYWYSPFYYSKGGRPASVVRQGDYKLIEHYDPASVELFNIREDISEMHDLANAQPEKTNELKVLLHQWISSMNVIPLKAKDE